MRIDFRSSKDNQIYFVIVANNGEPLATSEMYRNSKDCLHAANLIKDNVSDATFTVNGEEVN